MAEIDQVSGYCWVCHHSNGEIYAVSSSTDPPVLGSGNYRVALPESYYSEDQARVLMRTLYVQGQQLAERPTMELQIMLSETGSLLVDGVPGGTNCTLCADTLDDGPQSACQLLRQQFVADGTQIEISVEYSGSYSLHLENFPYQEVQETVRING